MDVRFDGECVIVTGAGNGLGRAYAHLFARRGASVVVNDAGVSLDGSGHDEAVADQVVAEIRAAGGMAVASYDNVAAPDGGRDIVGAALERFGRVDAVVNNAGTRRPNPIDRMTHDDFAAVVDTHLLGSFHVSQAAFEPMRRAGYGRLIFVGSSIGTFGNAGLANYAAAKAGIVGLANVFAIEGAQFGVTANTILPLAVTARSTAAHAAQTLGAQLAASSAAERQYDPDGQPLTWPDEVAPVVVALASRSCPFTRRVFTYGYGRLAEVFVGVTRGWYPQAPEAVTPEDVLGHTAEVEDRDGYVVPLSFTEEKNWIRALAPDA